MEALFPRERQFARLRPTLEEGFDFGQILDVLPNNRLRVHWVMNHRRKKVVDAGDVIPCGENGEQHLLLKLEEQLWSLRCGAGDKAMRKARKLVALAVDFTLEHWLDLRRDGINVQPDDFYNELDITVIFLGNQTPLV